MDTTLYKQGITLVMAKGGYKQYPQTIIDSTYVGRAMVEESLPLQLLEELSPENWSEIQEKGYTQIWRQTPW